MTDLHYILKGVSPFNIYAQEREAPQLNLDSLRWNASFAPFDSVTAFEHRPYLWGWNWLSTDGDISQTMGMNVWHLQDPFAGGMPAWLDFGAQRTPGQLLISTIADVTGGVTTPCEAISMEWQPWLEEDADTFELQPDDSTGGHLKDENTWLTFHPEDADKDGRFTSYITEWLGLREVGDITVSTRASGTDLASELYVQRESDGEVFNMNAVAKNQNGETSKRDFTLLASRDDRYRFFMETKHERTLPAEDVEIRFEKPEGEEKSGTHKQIVDLRSMKEYNATELPGIIVYPNPAGSNVTFVINSGEQRRDTDAFVLEVTSSIGQATYRSSCNQLDVLTIDVSAWPAGTYVVSVRSSYGIVCTQPIVVIR